MPGDGRRRAPRGAARRGHGRARRPRRPRRLGAAPAPGPASTAATWPPTRRPSPCSTRAGLGVLSEESGVHHGDRAVVVVVDPVDGSTNASRGAALVRHQPVRGRRRRRPRRASWSTRPAALRFEAVAGRRRPRRRRAARARRRAPTLGEALVGLSGLPAALVRLEAVPGPRRRRPRPVRGRRRPARRLRRLQPERPRRRGTTSAGLLVCQEAGAVVVDAFDRDARHPRPRRAAHARSRRHPGAARRRRSRPVGRSATMSPGRRSVPLTSLSR